MLTILKCLTANKKQFEKILTKSSTQKFTLLSFLETIFFIIEYYCYIKY